MSENDKKENEVKQEQEVENEEEKLSKKEEKKLSKAYSEIEVLKKECAEWKNKYYQSYADTDNLRKSLEKDYRDALKYRSSGFIDNLLPILDGFHMALQNEPNSPELKNYLVGFQYIYKNFVNALESEGVKEISVKVGDNFDAKNMHAIDTEYSEGKENLVTKVYAQGYMLHDRIIRPAMVYVSTSKKKEEVK